MVRLSVKPWKNGARCPQCGRRGSIIRTRPENREWRDLKVGGWQVSFVYAPREIQCVTHGRGEEQIPWAAHYSRITHRFEYVMLRLCQDMTQKAAAQLMGVLQSTLSDLLYRNIQRGRDGHRIRGTACCDMREAYLGAVTEHCPNATLVIDRFHIVKTLNEAVD